MSYQKIIIVGNLGKDPEVKYLDGSGTCVAAFSVATSETYKNKAGEKVTNTEWFRCVAWNKTGEIVEKYLTKGSKVLLELKKKERSYESKGEEKHITEFMVLHLTMLGSKPTEGNQGQSGYTQASPSNQASSTGQAPQTGTPEQSNNLPPEPNFDGDQGPDDLPF